MKLSELKTGQKGVIVKVLGHGGFRKRIVEMGFIKGQEVTVLLNAPLRDPVKYKIMGYEVSLRHNEASMIEIMSEEETKEAEKDTDSLQQKSIYTSDDDEKQMLSNNNLHDAALKKRRRINVALVGNPNCGKTSLFNFISGAHERVGNYSGVTVDAKEGHATFEGYDFNVIDLPGTYSLSCYSPEELYVRREIIDKTPDIIINVIDSSNIERNLYLTTQLVDMNQRIVCALNMFDEFEEHGDKLDYKTLGRLFGVPMVPTVFRSGKGVDELFRTIINIYEGEDNTYRHIHINHGKDIEEGIDRVKLLLQADEQIRYKYSTRYLAIKLLEMDTHAEDFVKTLPNGKEVIELRDKEAVRIKEEVKEDSETAIMNAKYGFINGALKEAGFTVGNKTDTYQTTHVIDSLLTNKYLGFPLFFLLLYVMFQATFSIGQYPMDWIESGIAMLSEWVSGNMPEGPLKAMVSDGIIGGVGAVIVFLPQILILYAFISFMEDSGYMARAAFIMGFGCNVPAVMATRTIESRRSRLITMLILPFMSCSARLPIYVMITSTFFALKYRSGIMISLYAIGILVAVVMSRVFSKWLVKSEDVPFVMELPPYRFPTAKAIARHTWEKGKQYLKKMGGIILVASIIVWALGYFPHNDQLTAQQQQEQSYIGRIGKTIEPVFRAQGFDWKLSVGLISGVGAKEIVASTMGVLYANDDSVAESDTSDAQKYHSLYEKMSADGITPLIAFCYLLFVLLYFPCLATIVAIKNESGSWKWAIFTAFYTTLTAWIVSALVYQIAQLF